MHGPIVFLDTETCGLAIDDPIWDFAAIRRNPDGSTETFRFYIEHDTARAAQLPDRYREDHSTSYDPDYAYSTDKAAEALRHLMRRENGQRVHVVGACPWFDTARISHQLLDGAEPWHHHLIDVENLAVGWLAAKGLCADLPWDSDELSRAVGVEPHPGERHTAMGDTIWARDLYDAITRGH